MAILERLYEVVEVGLRIGDAQSTAKMETIGLDRVRSEVEHGRYLFIGSANFDEHAQLLIGGREVGVLLLKGRKEVGILLPKETLEQVPIARLHQIFKVGVDIHSLNRLCYGSIHQELLYLF